MLEHLIAATLSVLRLQPILGIILGVPLGIIVGAIPGLTATMAVGLLIPFTFGMAPVVGFSMLMGVYVGGISGGFISATLLRMPGTPASIATCFDAYPMASKGKPAFALGLGAFSSFIGGMISAILLTIIAPYLGHFALAFGPFEYFSLVVLAMTSISSLSLGSTLKGLASGALGFLLSFVGTDPLSGTVRFNFGWDQLSAGFSLLPVLIGLFAVSQILKDIEKVKQRYHITIPKSFRDFFPDMMLLKRSWLNFFRSSMIGTWIGMLPGIGAATAGIISYSQAQNASEQADQFGQGHPDGIIAAETANNATTGGALIPLLTLGIPGNAVTAVLIGGLMIHNLQPGPLLFRNSPVIAYGIFVALILANIAMIFWLSLGIKLFIRILTVPKHLLLPILLVFCAVGSFALNNRIFDIWVLIFFGILGYIMEKADFPIVPIILGIILGPLADKQLRLGLSISNNSLWPLFTQPISLVCLILAIISLLWPYFRAESMRGEG